MVGGFGEGFLGIVGYEQTPNGARESNVIDGPILLLQLGDILVVYVAGRAWHREPIAIASGAAQSRRGEAAQPYRRMRFLNGFGRHLDVLEIEELALEGNSLSAQETTYDFERLISPCAALFERGTEAVELLVLEADPDAELKAAARDDIDYRNIFSEAHGIVEGHQEHARCDADPFGACGNRCGDR